MGMGLGQEGVLSTLLVALPQLLSVLFRLSVSLHTRTTHACSHALIHAHTHRGCENPETYRHKTNGTEGNPTPQTPGNNNDEEKLLPDASCDDANDLILLLSKDAGKGSLDRRL